MSTPSLPPGELHSPGHCTHYCGVHGVQGAWSLTRPHTPRNAVRSALQALQVQSTESPAASSMRRRALRPADPSSVRGELERKAEVRMAAAEREGQLKRQRDVAIEQVPCLGTSLGLEQLPRSYIRPHRCVLGTGRGRVQARLPQGCRRWPARSKYPCSPSHESMRPTLPLRSPAAC
jgi:hypothetical protein